ncbi:class I SAM-dependent methyltransferase [Microlunatus sp. GCM10028923]|uniref:class I SAM-dependent methyltransferase n=1 Tax=Microlunatus sp. GCM10028923 TaxID=3273400 RepID=UPI003623E3EE
MRRGQDGLVEAGYDEIAVPYQAWVSEIADDPRLGFLDKVLNQITARPESLDLGCGAGVPCTAVLAERGHATGVDLSAAQIELAGRNVPDAQFIKSDMSALEFPPESFDLVTAFYAIPHLPREDHGALFRRIAGWLRPGGRFLAALGHRNVDVVADFLGVPMVTSSYDAETNRKLLLAAGFTVQTDEVVTWYNGHVTYQWVIAAKT